MALPAVRVLFDNVPDKSGVGAWMVKLKTSETIVPPVFVALKVMLEDVPTNDGVPEMAPLVRLSPCGRVPVLIA